MSTKNGAENKQQSEEEIENDISIPVGYGKYNNTYCGWLEKRSKFVKKWRPRFCMSQQSSFLVY